MMEVSRCVLQTPVQTCSHRLSVRAEESQGLEVCVSFMNVRMALEGGRAREALACVSDHTRTVDFMADSSGNSWNWALPE